MARKAKKSPAKSRRKVKAKPAAKKRAAAPKRKTKKVVRPVRKAAAKKVTAKRSKPAPKRKAAKRAVRNDVTGEGNYTASRNFRRKETAFVKRNKAKIPAMGKAAQAALEGPEGAELLAAEAQASAHGVE